MIAVPEMRMLSDLATFAIVKVRRARDHYVITVRGCAFSDHPRCTVQRMPDSPHGCEYLLEVACRGVAPVFTPFETRFTVPCSEIQQAPQETLWLSGVTAMFPGGMMRKKAALPAQPMAAAVRQPAARDLHPVFSWVQGHLICLFT